MSGKAWRTVAKPYLTLSHEVEMDIKPRPNHRLYLSILRRMTPEQRLLKALDLSEFSKRLFLSGLRHQFGELSETAFKRLVTWMKAGFERLLKTLGCSTSSPLAKATQLIFGC